ncbi:substrate-binding domain-containing protein [Kutzneria kofuensis]|uniref:DNA-binding LacI/PurR family transcriptional regulator n=1 Tax=Kutzneria kofuensis TaxID=103725 RepID=A0A7W9KQP8_9PSEU|nr:substrate-binding domain-containing protein [Kutzneria kofuensis]MBB5896951.1 DNA-binding LacI/PurR family transcriptional regulator [Kutzneria kofuensis]
MREPGDDRRQRILAAVDGRGQARVTDLAAELDVSVVTVRRDVEQLAMAGKLARGHGVVRSMRSPGPQPPVRPQQAAVALVIPERHAYLDEAVNGARETLAAAGMRAVLHIAPRVAGAERPIAERIVADGVCGLLIAPRWRTSAAEEADYEWLAELDVPVVLMERRPRPGSVLHETDSACTDHWYGMHLAIDHLVGLGHRRIVLAARDDSPTARTLRSAFEEIAMARREVEDWAVTLSAPDACADPSVPDTSVPVAELIRSVGATAAVMHSDVDALMLVQRLDEAGIRVPRDCSVVAYDDVVAPMGSTPLTAIAPPKAEVGRATAELLLARLAGTNRPRRVAIAPELKIRNSTLIV